MKAKLNSLLCAKLQFVPFRYASELEPLPATQPVEASPQEEEETNVQESGPDQGNGKLVVTVTVGKDFIKFCKI